MNGKDIFLGLNYIDPQYVEEAEFRRFPAKTGETETGHRRKLFRRPFLLAAIIALMLLLVGCGVMYVLSMQSLKVGQQEFAVDAFSYDPDTGLPVEYLGKEVITEQVFTAAGLQDTPANRAAQEWFDFRQSYDPDGAILHEVWGKEPEFAPEYESYQLYTEEMKVKLDEILEKYNLKTAGAVLDFHTNRNACDALGIENIHWAPNGVILDIGVQKCWENGNFCLYVDMTLPGTTENQLSETWGTVRWNRKDCFSDDLITFEDTGDWKEWEYTTQSGSRSLITHSPSSSRGYLLFDRKEAVMVVMVETQWSYGVGQEQETFCLSDGQLEQIADAVDHAIQPRLVTREDVDNQQLPVGEDTQDGYTLKMKSVKTDGNVVRIRMGVTAPEGTVISRNPHEGFEETDYRLRFGDFNMIAGEKRNMGKKREVVSTNGGWNMEEDNDGLDNTADLVLELFAEMEDGSDPFGWGTGWDIWLEDIVGFYWDDQKHDFEEEVLAQGSWHLDLGFNERNGDYRKIQFAAEPITMQGITGWEMDGTDVFGEVKVTSFNLRTMSASIEYDYDAAVDFSRYDMPMYAVMKDGTEIPFVSVGGGTGNTWYIMESHVNVDEVDHVVLMDGTRLEVPQ